MTTSDMRTVPMNFMFFTGINLHKLAGWSCTVEPSEDLATKR